MPQRVFERLPVSPKDRLVQGTTGPVGYFYPGEVARLLGLELVNYRTLRQLYVLIKTQAGESPRHGWARFSLKDLAGLQAVLSAYGGTSILSPDRRLNLRPLAEACDALRSRGYENPLLQVPLRQEGVRVYALVDGLVVEARSNQLVVDTALTAAEGFLLSVAFKDRRLSRSLQQERRAAATLRAEARVVGQAERHLVAAP